MPIADAFASDPHGQIITPHCRAARRVYSGLKITPNFSFAYHDLYLERYKSVCEQRNAAVVVTVLERKKSMSQIRILGFYIC